MQRSIIKKVLVIAITFASFMSFTYLNCCAGVKKQLVPSIEQERIQDDNSLKMPDLKILEKSIDVIRKILPVS